MILCLTGGLHSVTGPASAAGIRAFNCWSALVLSSQARVEQSKERVLPKKKTQVLSRKRVRCMFCLYISTCFQKKGKTYLVLDTC